MSHFTVLAIGDNPEQQLAPYQENNMGDCPKHWLKFNDIEERSRQDYLTDKTSCFVSPEGEVVSKYDTRFRNPKYSPFQLNSDAEEYLLPDGWVEKDVPVSERFPTFDEYMREFCGNKVDPETGKYGYWENPNAKWDWYSLGGRWSGFFTTKDGKEVDTALIEEIDFDTKFAEKEKFALEVYDYLWPHIKDTPKLEAWTKIRVAEEDKGVENHIERARTIYHAQPRMVAFKAVQDSLRKTPSQHQTEVEKYVYWLDDEEMFNLPREEYAQQYAHRSVQTFAVVKDGRWFERGKMGWFACVSDEKDLETWQSIYTNLLKDLPHGTRLSLYDCHI